MSSDEKKFVPVMITPFDLKAKIDLDVVNNLIDFYLAAGATILEAMKEVGIRGAYLMPIKDTSSVIPVSTNRKTTFIRMVGVSKIRDAGSKMS